MDSETQRMMKMNYSVCIYTYSSNYMVMYIRIFTKESSGKYEYDCIGELFIKRNDGGGLDCRIRDGAKGRCGIANGEESAGSVDC